MPTSKSSGSLGYVGVVLTKILTGVLVAAVTIGHADVALAQHESHNASGLPQGVPDFCTGPTITSVASGNWSAPTTWSDGRVPGAGDRVHVDAGTVVTYDVQSDAAVDCADVDGILQFATDRNTSLKIGNLTIMAGGALEIGTATSPVPDGITAEIVIADKPLDTTLDPEEFGTGLIGFGRVSISGSPKTPTFTRLAAEPMAGDPTLQLSEAPTGWKAGDKLILPDTRQLMNADMDPAVRTLPVVSQYEELAVASVSGTTVTLTKPLQFTHKGARDMTGHLDFLPHVGNLTRNVLVRSANPLGTRGHMLATGQANVDIRYAAFQGMGRTTIQPLNSAVQNPDGTWTLEDTTQPQNQIGRYPIHMHHLRGPASKPANGYQFTLIGNVVDDASKWSIAVHDSHFGLVQDNVVYHAGGAGVVTEDGSETQNLIDHNFVVRVTGTGGRDGLGREGLGFWFRGTDNIVTNNVASNLQSDNYESAYGFNYYLIYLGYVRTPNFPGADTMDDAQVTIQDGNAVPIRKFDTNEVYGATESGATFYWIGAFDITPEPNMPESMIKGFKVWHVFNRAIYHYPTNHLTIDGMVVRGSIDEAGENGVCCQHGVDFGDYYSKDLVYKNFDIQGRATAFDGSILELGSTVTIQDGHLANMVNVAIQTMITSNYAAETLGPRTYVFRNVRMDQRTDVPTLPPGGNIVLIYGADPVRNLTALDQILVYDFNGVVGDNFRVYYTQQDPSFIVPVQQLNDDGTHTIIGAPVANLTNAQTWAQYGIAIAGAVAPCSTMRPDFVNAFTCPVP